ncbi:MAG: hypothetical protein KDJ86_00175 [Bauldia sp.]|uniref:hypothetical protein n=1 Tax=Bauldia sp. TaxID=2575872 RepID=UPI001D6E4860|nr:hypothetical protein [Bauldia sp.]MCB1494171.1 hypothetical protein [Bauldia sp.]
MARVPALAVAVSGVLALAGCSQTTTGAPEALAVTGDSIAGTSPAEAAATAAIGIPLDKSAARKAHEAEIRALEHGRTGVPVAWRSGKFRGEVVPGAMYQVNAYTCRDYTQTVYVSGQPPQATRQSACRQPDGSWKAVS